MRIWMIVPAMFLLTAAGGAVGDEATQQRGAAGASATSAYPSDRSGTSLTNQEVRDAQTALRDIGLYDGEVDGIYGPQTIEAVRQFQEQENLPRTSALDERTQHQIQQAAAAPGGAGKEQKGPDPARQAPDARTPPQGAQ